MTAPAARREPVPRRQITVDANEAVASVAYRLNEVIAIYPITPASPMGEHADAWAVQARPNLWGSVPEVVEMQSEGGAAGTVHGALQAGALTTSFTASQGLLLMIPNLYKIAGELTPFVLHVAARTVATHALSIFCDHSDVMAARQTGMALLCSGSVQEAQDFALIAQAASLRTRIPFLHFFDGFRTSHEIQKIVELADDDLRSMIDVDGVEAHRRRALTPDRPVVRGTAQNPDAFFQAREAINPYYMDAPAMVQEAFDAFAARTGRSYALFDYHGHPEAERVVVLMGSAAGATKEAVDWLVKEDEKVGLLEVRLYRPFSIPHFVHALPETVKTLAVLDRTKEPGAPAEPLYLDVVGALKKARFEGLSSFAEDPVVLGGRYGLSSKELTPASVRAVFDEMARGEDARDEFTVGISDDVTHLSVPVDEDFDVEPESVVRAVFYGLGSDGTVSAAKSSVKIVGESTDQHVQGYFVYDSKKAGAVTVSHLRFGPEPIRSTYLIRKARFVACHQFDFLYKMDVLERAAPGATFLLNSPYGPEEVWDRLPREVQEQIVDKSLDLYVLDAYRVAREAKLGPRINTVMQTAFFALVDVLPVGEAVAKVKAAVETLYGKRGKVVVQRNFDAVDRALEHLHRVEVPGEATSDRTRPPVVPPDAPDFVQRVTAVLMAGRGDRLPVSAFPPDGTWPLGTTKYEKRNIAASIPLWDPDVCIQCNQCVLVCPHATIRAKVYEPELLADAPEGFLAREYKAKDFRGLQYTLQVAPEDCTGCSLCVEVCPAKNKAEPKKKAIFMAPRRPNLEEQAGNWSFFLDLPEVDAGRIQRLDAKGSQFLQPLFEYSGACSGCGETPYVKLLTQLFGDRLLIANATGCSSIYGGNLPTTPYTTNGEGRGPAWSNSLFEDNAEFGLGFRLAVDGHARRAAELLQRLAPKLGDEIVSGLLEPSAKTLEEAPGDLEARRRWVDALRRRLEELETDHGPERETVRALTGLADYLVPKSVWLVGGDGWAYDIGYGGLDHVLALGRNVNVLVLDTEVYSNTGGQQSKATPLGAAAKFAAAGREIPKKDLGLEAMSYGHVYVARIAFGGKINQTVQALREAEEYPGPSLVIAYSPCVAHGYDLKLGAEQQRKAVETGIWPLYRFDPRRVERGEPPLMLDSGAPQGRVEDYLREEARFRMVEKLDPERYRYFVSATRRQAERRYSLYAQLAGITLAEGAEEVREGGVS